MYSLLSDLFHQCHRPLPFVTKLTKISEHVGNKFFHAWWYIEHNLRFLMKVTRRIPLKEEELLTLQYHLSSLPPEEELLITLQYHLSSTPTPVFSRVYVAQSLVFCVVFYGSLFVFGIIVPFPIWIIICYYSNIFSPLNYYI